MSFILRIAITLAIIILLETYFAKKILKAVERIYPAANPKTVKRWLIALLIVFNLYPLFLLSAWGYAMVALENRIIVPQHTLFDYLIVYPFWIFAFIIIQSVLFFVTIDIIRLITYPFLKSSRERILRIQSVIILAVTTFCILYVPARVIYDYNTVSIRNVIYEKENLHPALENFRIAFISDIQADRFTDAARLERYISKLNELKPDLVLIAGDLITSTPDFINKSAHYVGKIESVYGVYSCLGDHDHWAYRPDTERSIREITQAMELAGVKLIDNEKRFIDINDARIGITFVTNTYVSRIEPAVLDSLMNKSRGLNLKILLSHQPGTYLVQQAVKYDYDLLLAGHTHGGQITFLYPFYNLSPTLFETRFVRGDFRFDNLLMIVNRGLGMSLVPMRYNSTPEITLISLSEK